MRKGHLTLNIFIMIVMTDIAESVAQLLMKKGLLATGVNSISFANLSSFIAKSSASWLIWLGILVYVANFFIWITILSRIDLSVAFPVGSTSYVMIPILSMIFLNESVNPIRWAGIVLIVLGIHFVSKSSRQTKAG